MIQRSLLRQIRASSSRLHQLPISSASRSSFLAPRIPALSSRQQLHPRCYSTTTTTAEAQASPKGDPSTSTTPTPPSEPKEEDPIKKELEAKKAEIIDLKDKYLRSVADFRNLQERTKRETQAAKDFAISRFARDLVESIDNLDRALSTVPVEKLSAPPSSSSSSSSSSSPSPSSSSSAPDDNNKDLINLHEGLKMTEQILMQTLKKHGLERFDPSERGEKFDPNLHEATFMTRVEGKEDGTAFHTQQKGFLLNGRVIRAAKVGVVKNS